MGVRALVVCSLLFAAAAHAREVRCPLPPRRPPVVARTNAVLRLPRLAVSSAAETDRQSIVDVLVAYDLFAERWVNKNAGGVTNFAESAIARMNEALTNSNIHATLAFRLAGVAIVRDVGGTDFDGVLDDVTYGIGAWNVVGSRRDELGADVAVTLIDTGSAYGVTGLSWALDDQGYDGFADHAFSVCAVRAVAESHTMTHEVGHLFGAGHSDAQADDPGPLLRKYSSGYYFETNGVPCHTIMAYDADGYGNYYEETPYFSSPDVLLGDVAVGTPTNDNARTLRETAAHVASFRIPRFTCWHDSDVESWTPGSGCACKAGDDGDVWQWCHSCRRWIGGAPGFEDSRATYVICHGHANSIDETWLRDMADALPVSANVLAVNWGKGADQVLPHLSAAYIPLVVRAAERNLKRLGVDWSQTTAIGHSHGAHVAGNIVYDVGEADPVARFVGLETSTDEFGVHDANRLLDVLRMTYTSYGPDRWTGDITNRCRQVEYYKTSWIMSLAREKTYGHYNFVVVDKGGLPEELLSAARVEASLTNGSEIARHSFAHEWFTKTIRGPASYAGLGFNFHGSASLAGGDGFCGLIRDTVLTAPMGCFVTFANDEGLPLCTPRYYDCGRVYALPSSTDGGWSCSNGKRYDDGVLVFDLGRGGETITMTAIRE